MSWRARITENVQQVRLFFCPNTTSSDGMRKFIGKNYEELKMLNPDTPFLIRGRDGAPTQLWVRYDHGVEEMRELGNASEQQVEAALRELVLRGETKRRFAPMVRGDYVVDADTFESTIWNDGLLDPAHEGVHDKMQ